MAANEASVNDYRTARVAQILEDFRTLQLYIAAAPTEPTNSEDRHTEGWAALRQCAIDGQYILECAADTSVPTPSGGEQEQQKAELKQYVCQNPLLPTRIILSQQKGAKFPTNKFLSKRVLLDAYARRHEGQKIYLRQASAQRWVDWREHVLQGGRPSSKNRAQLQACDFQLQTVRQATKKTLFQLPCPLVLIRWSNNCLGARHHYRPDGIH